MKVVSTGKRYECPHCGTVVKLDGPYDVMKWNSVEYYRCPKCKRNVLIKGSFIDRTLCPYTSGPLAEKV